MSSLLTASSLYFGYVDILACQDLNFEVNQGEVVTLIGANGAGKSTTMKGIAGTLASRSGSIFFEGKDITKDPSHIRAKNGIALVPEGRRVFPFLTVLENLEMGGFKYRGNKQKINQLIEQSFTMFPRLKERSNQRAGTLSGGEQQMLALSRALMSEPKLLCLDEPSLGLAPLVVQEIFRNIRLINTAGVSVLLVEQNANYALAVAHRGYVLKNGVIIASGTSEQLKADEKIQMAYLGTKK